MFDDLRALGLVLVVSCCRFGCDCLLGGAVLMCRFVFVSCVVCVLSFVDLPRAVWWLVVWCVLGLVGDFPVGWYFRFLLLLPGLYFCFWWLGICVVWVFYCFGWYGVGFRVLVVG